MENEVVRPTIVSYSARGSQWNQASPVVSLASALNWQYFRWSSRLGLVVVCDVAVLLLRISACADAGSGLGVWPDWRAQPRPLANYVDGHCVCAVLSWVGGFVLWRETVLGLRLDVDWYGRTGLVGLMVVTRMRRTSGRWGSSLRWQKSSLGLYQPYSFQSVFGQAKTFDGLAGGEF